MGLGIQSGNSAASKNPSVKYTYNTGQSKEWSVKNADQIPNSGNSAWQDQSTISGEASHGEADGTTKIEDLCNALAKGLCHEGSNVVDDAKYDMAEANRKHLMGR